MKNKDLFDTVMMLYEEAHALYNKNTAKELEAIEALKEHPDSLNLQINKSLASTLRSNYLGQMSAYVEILKLVNKKED